MILDLLQLSRTETQAQQLLVSRGHTLFSRRGVIACSISAPFRAGAYTTSDNAPARK